MHPRGKHGRGFQPAACRRRCLPLALAAGLACTRAPETVFSVVPATWFEDGWSYFDVSPDGHHALFGARFGLKLADLREGRLDPASYPSPGAARRAGGSAAAIAWGGDRPADLTLPDEALARLSPDGSRLAFFVPGTPRLAVGAPDALRSYELDGIVTGMGWVPRGDLLYIVVLHAEGFSSLDRLNVETGAIQPVRERLDAPPRFNSVAVSPDSRVLYLALAGDSVPPDADRHRPEADRDTDIYALDLARGTLMPVVEEPGDDFYPVIAGGYLYWTHNDFEDQVVVVPAAGGEARLVVAGGQLPSWSPDGKHLAYTYGGWRIADWALDLDAAVVTLDDSLRPAGPARPIVTGYHEDFTPVWSPRGNWLAYHSHRSPLPVPGYASPGSTDDIYLRRPDAPMAAERRLTDWGWEVGMPDWAPDGRRLVFDSWERGGPPGTARPWIVTVDTATGRLLERRRLQLPDAAGGSLFASWSPRGDRIALVTREGTDRQALWLIAPDGSGARRLVSFAGATYGGLDWTPDGSSLVYAALAGERMQVFGLRLAGGPPVQLTHDAADLLHPQVSPDGRWIAATRIVHRKSLKRKPL